MARKKSASELIVRELSAAPVNVAAIAGGGTEVQNNVANFFNNTPYRLDLIAIRIGSIFSQLISLADVSQQNTLFAVAEVSRQGIAGQQEGILGNVRSVVSYYTGTAAIGGKATYNSQKGEIIIGDFKTPLITLEVQETVFLHSVMTNSIESSISPAAGVLQHSCGCTLYFRVRSTGY